MFKILASVAAIAGFCYFAQADAQSLLPESTRAEKVEEFKLANQMWFRSLSLARAAAACGLRSERWYGAFDTWNTMRSANAHTRLKFTDREAKDLELDANRVMRTAMEGITCNLIRGRELDDLDQLYDRIPVGYR